MFYRDTSNNRYYIGTPFTYGNYAYTSSQATHVKFLELGFTQVIPQSPPDRRFYIVVGPDAYGNYSSTPRELSALKANFIKDTKRDAYNHLRGTDWYVLRLLELGTTNPVHAAIPEAVTTYRQAIRTTQDARCTQINEVGTVEELSALINASPQIYDQETQTFSVNSDALAPWPELDTATYATY